MKTAKIQPLDIAIALQALAPAEGLTNVSEHFLDTGKDTPPTEDTAVVMFVDGDVVTIARCNIDAGLQVRVFDPCLPFESEAEGKVLTLPGRCHYVLDTDEQAEQRSVTFEAYARVIIEHFCLGGR